MLHLGADAYAGGQAIWRAGAVTSAFAYELVFFLHVDCVFIDGFESGDTGAWSVTVQ